MRDKFAVWFICYALCNNIQEEKLRSVSYVSSLFQCFDLKIDDANKCFLWDCNNNDLLDKYISNISKMLYKLSTNMLRWQKLFILYEK